MFGKVLVCLALACVVAANQEAWENYKVKFARTYATEDEHQLRYAAFKTNLDVIEAHNAKYDQGLVTWYMAVNEFSDLTPEEFKANYLSATPLNTTRSLTTRVHQSILTIPDSIDWRNYGVVTGVKNQGGCGSCWTFSATGTLEGAYALHYGQLISFSEQELVDCATDASGYSGAGCDGGVVQSGLDYVRDHGMVTEDSYPYEGAQGSCRQDGSVFQISGYTEINANDEGDLKNAVGSVGPVSVALNADGMQSYGGGIYNDAGCSTSIDHGMLVVGYGNDGIDYWIIKNSWGDGWGESGYIRMAIGSNMCNIAAQACYPNV